MYCGKCQVWAARSKQWEVIRPVELGLLRRLNLQFWVLIEITARSVIQDLV